MLATRVSLLFLGVIISTSSWALSLKPGNLFKGVIHGKDPEQACFLEVKNVNAKDGTFHLVMFKNNSKGGRHFTAHDYNTNLTAVKSSSFSKDAMGKTIRKVNEKDVLHISPNMNPNGNYAIENAVILNDQTVMVNCLQMQRVR